MRCYRKFIKIFATPNLQRSLTLFGMTYDENLYYKYGFLIISDLTFINYDVTEVTSTRMYSHGPVIFSNVPTAVPGIQTPSNSW